MTVLGGGSCLDIYVVHLLEMVMHVFGSGAERVHYERCADQETVKVEFSGGRVANMIFSPCLGFAAIVADECGKSHHVAAESDFFYGQMHDIIALYEGRPISFDARETLELAAIRAAVLRARDEGIDGAVTNLN